MSTPFVTTAMPRLSDEELKVYDGVLKDIVLAQNRSRPALKSLFGSKLRNRTQDFVVLDGREDRPEEFDAFQFRGFEASSVQLDSTEASRELMEKILGIFEAAGHHFDNLQIRCCKQDDVLIYSVQVKADEPDLKELGSS